MVRSPSMPQRPPPPRWTIDEDDPRAPPQALWDELSERERDAIVAALPIEVPIELHPPEGDAHRKAKQRPTDALDAFFRRLGRKVYVSSELGTYYPNEPRFCPDVMAVLDVETHERDSWIVSREGRGLDLVLEVHCEGDRHKDFELNVERYARLGIKEYFLFDRSQLRLFGYRLPRARARTYVPIVPRRGLLASNVLGLEVRVEGERLKFYYGTAPVPDVDELIGRLDRMLGDLTKQHESGARELAAAEARADREAQRAQEEAQRADVAERRVAALEKQLAARPPKQRRR